MPAVERAFADSNLWVYAALDQDGEKKCVRAREFLRQPRRWVISGQVLSEVANVLLRNGLSRSQIEEQLALIVEGTEFQAVTAATVRKALELKQLHRLSFYDAQIAASALMAGCGLLYTEDMHHGLVIENVLRVLNPFLSSPA